MKLFHYKSILAFTAFLCLISIGYIGLSLVSIFNADASKEAESLIQYSARALSRHQANPELFASGQHRPKLGNYRFDFLSSYDELKNRIGNVPKESEFTPGLVKAINVDITDFVRASDYILLLAMTLSNGSNVYSYHIVDHTPSNGNIDRRIIEVIQPAITMTVLLIFALVISGIYQLRRAQIGVKKFEAWADELKTGNTITPPQFSSSKLNYMAFALEKSLQEISEALEKEHNYAKYTSHELRAPVAVLSANLEMMELIKNDLDPREQTLIKNMDSAISDMKYHMEALLYLGSENHELENKQKFDVREVLEKSLDVHLAQVEKSGSMIDKHLVPCIVDGNKALLQIIINNLIRNAFQHSSHGKVSIKLNESSLDIINVSPPTAPHSSNRGYGIGTIIIEKLVNKMGIIMLTTPLESGRKVTLEF